MKSATQPSLRVDPQLRKAQADFLARGMAARERARATGVYAPARQVEAQLRALLDAAQHARGA